MKSRSGLTRVEIWTDGSALRNPGHAGWAAVILFGQSGRIIGGSAPLATNNQMEVQAVTEALNTLKHHCDVTIYTDSSYVVTVSRKVLKGVYPDINAQYWVDFRKAAQRHFIHVKKVRGHDDDDLNNLADITANFCALKQISIDSPYHRPKSKK